MPWLAERAHGAAVVHAGQDRQGLVRWTADLGSGRVPQRPFALVGQMTTIDPSRSPEGTEALFGTNDFYPFVRSELKTHDPETHALLRKLWGVDK